MEEAANVIYIYVARYMVVTQISQKYTTKRNRFAFNREKAHSNVIDIVEIEESRLKLRTARTKYILVKYRLIIFKEEYFNPTVDISTLKPNYNDDISVYWKKLHGKA